MLADNPINCVLTTLLVQTGLTNCLDCKCGQQFTGTRIVGGKESSSGNHPWMVALIAINTPEAISDNRRGRQFCGGTLINDRFVMTAAHCLVNQRPSNYRVVIGETDLTAIRPDSIHSIRNHVIHQDYSGQPNYQNDIALIELDQQLEFTNSVWPACLPAAGVRNYGQLTISGWGLTTDKGKQSTKLLEASVFQRTSSYCRTVYGSKFGSKQLCANGVGRDVCKGDSGGPLMAKATTGSTDSVPRVFVVGIVSYGMICGYLPAPSVFTRVTKYIDWINSNAKSGSFCTQ